MTWLLLACLKIAGALVVGAISCAAFLDPSMEQRVRGQDPGIVEMIIGAAIGIFVAGAVLMFVW